MSHRKKDNCSS